MVVTFDVETSTHNKGNCFSTGGKLVSYSVKVDNHPTSFNYYTNLDFLHEIRSELSHASLIVTFNGKFDLNWMRTQGIFPRDRARIWDCQIAEFIISGQTQAYPSLNGCLEKYGLGQKDDKISEYWDLGIDTQDIPVEELEYYNNLDVELTYQLYLKQKERMTTEQATLCLLMGLDLVVLADMEYNGLKFDVSECRNQETICKDILAKLNSTLLALSPTPDINLDSGQQLSCLLYGGIFELDYTTPVQLVYKSGPNVGDPYTRNRHQVKTFNCPSLFSPISNSETKLKSKLSDGTEQVIYFTNEETLKKLKCPTEQKKEIIRALLERAEVAKLLDTYYGKLPQLLEDMEWGEYLHPQYNQTVTQTGRLSSSKPNAQNFSSAVDKLLISEYE